MINCVPACTSIKLNAYLSYLRRLGPRLGREGRRRRREGVRPGLGPLLGSSEPWLLCALEVRLKRPRELGAPSLLAHFFLPKFVCLVLHHS